MNRLVFWVITLFCALPVVAFAQPVGAPPAAVPSVGAANPHTAPQRPTDHTSADADLPAGSIEATIHDAHGNAQAGMDVRLGILFQTVAEGESRDSKSAKAAADGRLRFDGLKVGSGYSYRVSVRHGPAEYASVPFNLREDAGQRVLLHVYPATTDVAKTKIQMRGFLYIAPRDDVFQFEVLFRVFNLGEVTWIPRDVVLTLPKDFKAFRADESMSDTKFEALEGRGAKLVGTFSPGQHQLAFRFQVPRGGSDAAAFKVGVPRRVVEMRVIAEANANMHLEVDGFEPTQPDVAQTGTRVLVTRKLIQREDEEIGTFSAVLSGLPTPGLGRWIAVAIATLLAGAGLAAARGTFDRSIDATSGNEEDRRHARDLILDQLVALERARKTEEVGPRAYERAHQELLDALARLGVEADPAPRKKAKRGASKHPSEASTG